MSRVLDMALKGFPAKTDEEPLKPWVLRQSEISLQDGIIMWGNRVAIPPPGRDALLRELHDGHPGIVRMKAVARSMLWWPGMDQDVELMVKKCEPCQKQRPNPPVAPLHPWEFTRRPWSRLHIDHCEYNGKMILVIMDSHTKWLEVCFTSSTSSSSTIRILRNTFSTHGLPDVIVSDNATGFTSAEFKEFCTLNGIQHITSAPYHPASNGLAERAVQIVKAGLKRMEGEGTDETKLCRFLFAYRRTPHSVTGRSPAELLFNREIKSRLSLLKPDLESRVHDKQQAQKYNHDKKSKERLLIVGDLVYARVYSRNKCSWMPAVVTRSTGPVSYEVRLTDGRTQRCHVDQLMLRSAIKANCYLIEKD
jgi:transposase InsO family protein